MAMKKNLREEEVEASPRDGQLLGDLTFLYILIKQYCKAMCVFVWVYA